MNVLITGSAGVLGSSLAKSLMCRGFRITAMDTVRPEEAWRLKSIISDIKYVWKSVDDITERDLKKIDLIFDCAIGSPDRPFGQSSPIHTTLGNIVPPLNLLERTRHLDKKPIIVYPSSFNALYGHNCGIFNENTLPLPTSVYGWSKASVELLYKTYYFSYGVPVIITRTSSAFGPRGRSDELPHKLIIYALRNADFFQLRSPKSRRLWTYIGDALDFYEKLTEKLCSNSDELIGSVLHVAGNKNDTILENVQLAKIIKSLTKSDMKIEEGKYESGEFVNGNPINFSIDTSFTKKMLNWQPKWSVEDGMKKTIAWFEENIEQYNNPSKKELS
ncbi:MAG: NAD(P)-dependent oxidoreductase [Candidatus Thermoplasmatota archaeon]|nr:NAD(P)-dependent oxidoreductase [Candidatus Thermoplasmatota archaeon]